MQKRLTTTLLVLLLCSMSAHAAKWVTVSRKGQPRAEIDVSSLVDLGNDRVRAWYRETFERAQLPESGAFSFTRRTTLGEFACKQRSAVASRQSYTLTDGSEQASQGTESRGAMPVEPDSTMETVFTYACAHRPRPAPEKKTETTPPATTAPAMAAEPGQSARTSKKKRGEAEVAPPPHWSYTGETGPEKWAALSSEFTTCREGRRQSPIDIRRTVHADLPPIRFDYQPVPLAITDNGHSVQVDAAGAGSITIEGEPFELLQFHFHTPSEEKIVGKAYDMDIHLVHRSKGGKLAVVAILVEKGKENRLIQTLWSHLPLEKNKQDKYPEVAVDPNRLLPDKRGYYTFIGSLTTPPCTEGVLWLVLKTPIQMSGEQLSGFSTVYNLNARPTQPVNGRVIKGSR